MKGQMSIWDAFKTDTCDGCTFRTAAGTCGHDKYDNGFCLNGSFRIDVGKTVCRCGGKIRITQNEFGSDSGHCKCGRHYIFNNQGNRLGHYEAYKMGLIK